MRTIRNRFFLMIMPALLLLTGAAYAQVNIQIRVTPPYLSRVSDYASRPELMLLTVTNLTRTPAEIQFAGSITGDNGISARTKAGYRSAQPITLGPLETRNLNAQDIVSLFNVNTIDYTGISAADINRGFLLPEGTYTICVRALEFNTHEPLSPEEPVGCTQFMISNAEPPAIISPFHEQELSSIGPQAFPITWSTPPGASPATQYVVRMVEMIVPRNPNDAMLSATTPPFFERTVSGNTLLYGPAEPALAPGRQYALMVQAVDPFQRVTYRNEGRSEVIGFVYGKADTAAGGANAGGGRKPDRSDEQEKEYATNRITGKFTWAFKKSEENFSKPVILAATAVAAKTSANTTAGPPSPVIHYLAHNPLQTANQAGLAIADQTLSSRVVTELAGRAVSTVPKVAAPDAATVISTGGTESLAYSYETVQPDSGSRRYPLANVTVTVRGIKAQQSSYTPAVVTGTVGSTPVTLTQDIQWAGLRTKSTLAGMLANEPAPVKQAAAVRTRQTVAASASGAAAASTVLATARTNAEGSFVLQLLNPEYEGKNPYSRLVVSVGAEGFEPFEYELPVSRLSELESIDLGEKVILAKTYRFNPKVTIEQSDDTPMASPGMRMSVYREASQAERYPYLMEEGNLHKESRTPVLINGKRYIRIAVDSIAASGQPGRSYEFNFGRLFYTGNLYVEMEGMSGSVRKRSATLRVSDTEAGPSRILVAKPVYKSYLSHPAVSGEVILQAGESLVPVPGAVLVVEYDPGDVQPGMVSGTLAATVNTATFQVANIAALSGLMKGQSSGTVSPAAGSSQANPVAAAAALSQGGLSRPVTISHAVTQGSQVVNGSFEYHIPLIVGEDHMTDAQLRNKYGQYAVKTDENGQYHIGNLPLLKEGTGYTVKLVSVPYKYRDMEVKPGKEQSFTAGKGVTETRSFSIAPEIFNLVGRVINPEKSGVPFARLHFKGSSTYFESGEAGHFQTSFYAGEHTLVIEKEGYMPLEVPVRLGFEADPALKNKLKEVQDKWVLQAPVKPGDPVMNMANPGTWVQSMQQTNTVKSAVAAGQVFSPAMFGWAAGPAGGPGANQPVQGGGLRGPSGSPEFAGPDQLIHVSAFSMQVSATFRMNEFAFSNTESQDLGDIGPLLPRIGKVRFAVVDKQSRQPVSGAVVQLFDSVQVTDAQGQWLYEGFGGQVTVAVNPPAGSGYVPLQRSVQIDETGLVTDVTLELEKGIRVYGTVTGAGAALEGARVMVEGKDYLSAFTDASGTYELFLPAGEQVIRASRSGYFTKKENRVLQQGTDLVLDFSLEDGGGRNISTLLGFDIELDRTDADGSGEKWTGRFVNMKPLESLFKGAGAFSLPFANIRVTFDAQGNAIPQNNEVLTDATNLSMKLFGFLPVTLKSGQQIKVKRDAGGQGSISGQLQLNVGQIQGSRGFTFPTNTPLFVALQQGSGPADIEVFRAGIAAGAPDIQLKLAGGSGSEVNMSLYGFSLALDLGKSAISANGLDLAGTISTPALGPVTSASIRIETFSISRELRIQTVKVAQAGLPSIKIGGWQAALTAALFNENGFKLGGKLKFSIPQSGESNVDFANLSLGKDALYGGQFSFPGNGINVYNIVKLTSGGNPLSFGRIGNTQVYYLSGSANMKFDKLITKEIRIPSFQVQTDARFLLQAPVNYSADLSFAKFNIKNLTVSSLSGQSPFISVQGEFNVNFPGLKFNASDIRFKANTSGGTDFTVGTISGELAVAVMKVGVTVGLKENGFEGGGRLGIPGTPINAEVNFHYFKDRNSGGIDLGAAFKAGVSIPIGIVEITKVGGGFSYNTGNKKFMININGGASITGLRAVVALDPISLTVTDGPVIVGEVGVKVATAFELARAKVELNFPGKFFAIQVNSDIEPLKGVASARLNGLLRIRWNPDDPYVFLGVNTEVNVLGFFRSYGEYAVGVNIWDPKHRGDDISGYFRYLDDDLYASGQDYLFSGVYLHAKTEIGLPKERAASIDLKIVSGKAWFHSTSDVMLLLNFGANDYRFRLAGSLSVGAEGCIGPGCIGAEFGACYKLTGGFSDYNGWFVSGKAGGYFSGRIGCDADCNSLGWALIVPCGGRICVYAHASIDIKSRRGVHLGVGLGSSNEGNMCAN